MWRGRFGGGRLGGFGGRRRFDFDHGGEGFDNCLFIGSCVWSYGYPVCCLYEVQVQSTFMRNGEITIMLRAGHFTIL